MFKVKNVKTNTTFSYPTVEEALEMINRYKNLELVEEKEQPKEEKDLSPIDRYIPKPKSKTKK